MQVARQPENESYHAIAVALHWAIAIALLFELGLGTALSRAQGPGNFESFQLHKSVGITILLLTLLRLGWRLAFAPPELPEGLSRWERLAASVAHIGFYGFMIALPLTGWLAVSTSKLRIETVLFKVLAWPAFPGTWAMEASTRAQWHSISEAIHGWLGYGLYLLIALHVVGALKHQFYDKKTFASRMLPIAHSRLAAGLAGAVLVGCAALATGVLIVKSAPSKSVQPTSNGPQAGSRAGAIPAMPNVPTDSKADVDPSSEAAPTATPTPTEATVSSPSAWQVNKSASTLGFSVDWSGRTLAGRFSDWRADIVFDPEALDKSRVTVSIGMASAATGESEVDSSLPSEDWFGSASHPRATFTATKFTHLGGQRYSASGTLTLRGRSRPVALTFTLQIDGDTARMTGSASIDRLAFGVGQGEWASTTEVGSTVTVNVKLTAQRITKR